MWTAAFPEPLTFSLRALRALRQRPGDFDVVHDNRVFAYGMLGIARLGLPLVTSIHHPISVDRRIELAAAHRLGPAVQAPVVRLQCGCRAAGRAPGRAGAHRLGVLPRRHLPRFPGAAGERARYPARRRYPAVPSAGPGRGRTAGSSPSPARTPRSRESPPCFARWRSLPPNGTFTSLSWASRLPAARPSGSSASSRSATGCASSPASATFELAELAASARSPSCRRCTRGSRSRRSSTWRPVPRWWPAAPAPCRRSPATPPCW